MNVAGLKGWRRKLLDWLHTHPSLIAALVLAAGFLLRLKTASGTFLNPDEALHFLVANQPSVMAVYRASLDTSHPPLLFLVLNLWRNFGTSELVLRLPSVIAGTVFCGVFFKWLTEVLGRAAGWAGLIFAVFLPPMVELSAEIRQYALLLCFMAVALYCFERSLATASASRMLLSFLSLYLATLSHYSGILFAGAIGGYGLLRLTSQGVSRRVIAVWVAGQAVALGLFIFLYRTHISQLKGSDVAQRTMNRILSRSYFHWGHDHLFLFMFARTFGVCQFVFGQLAIGDVAGLALVTAIVLLLRGNAWREQSGPTPRQLGTLLLLPFAINCGAAIVDLYPYGGTRHSSFLAPFVIAGVSFLLAKLAGRQISRGVGAAIAIVVLCQGFGAPHRPYMLRQDQRSANMTHAIAAIRQQVSPPDRIFVDFQTYFVIRDYLCPDIGTAFETPVTGFRSFRCSGYEVISTDPETNIFDAGTFLERWGTMLNAYGLPPGETVWVFQAGWDIGLAQELQKTFPEFRGLKAQSFGRNISLFKLTVGQPMPAGGAPAR